MLRACRGNSYDKSADSSATVCEGGRFFFTSQVCNEIIRSLTERHPESIVDVVARAEVLAGEYGGGITEPSLSFILAKAYCYSGDARFLDRLTVLIANGDEVTGNGASRPYDQGMVWRAARLVSDLFAFHLVHGSGHLAAEKLVQKIRTDCAALTKIRKSAGSLARVMAAGAVAQACMSLPGLGSSDRRRERGLATLSELIGEYAFPSRPLSLGERCLVAETYLSLIALSLVHGLDVPAHVLGGVEAVVDSIAQDSAAPVARGGSELVLNIAPFEASASSEAILSLSALLFDRLDLAGGEFRVAETVMWLMGVTGLEEYESFCTEEMLTTV
ncbi:MAG: hypothetical protein KAW17_05790 [Candidatus Eisenbacteria sp.]|nr:hypothetical protein [Candidatus Eisenbacteria bacterium]